VAKAAGFELGRLFTTVIEEYQRPWRAVVTALLEEHRYDTANRGEETWRLAKKRAFLPVDLFPRAVFGP
jgi:hypothetical protein